jgi:DNA modification methylase
LDTRQGYWQKRKRHWKELIGDMAETRENAKMMHETIKINNKIMKFDGDGVSLLDPVLSEIICKWYSFPECKIFDCFAGDTVFGYVSSYYGHSFLGIELRKEQTDLNNERIVQYEQSKYICDDGQNIASHIEPESQDLLFSCPPYYDLEKYSDLKNDASNQESYNDFVNIITKAFTDSIKCLKQNRFAVIVIGDVRDRITGAYYDLITDIKNIMRSAGCILYNEIILIEMIGSAMMKASRWMKSRKVVKTHQNILVFYKGDTSKIKEIYPDLKEDYSQFMELNESANLV